MFLHPSVILFTGGCTPPGQTPPEPMPRADTTPPQCLGQTPPRPLGQTPPWADTPPNRHPLWQTHSWADTTPPLGRHPPLWADTPLGRHSPGQTPPPPPGRHPRPPPPPFARRALTRVVRILLECILVLFACRFWGDLTKIIVPYSPPPRPFRAPRNPLPGHGSAGHYV